MLEDRAMGNRSRIAQSIRWLTSQVMRLMAWIGADELRLATRWRRDIEGDA